MSNEVTIKNVETVQLLFNNQILKLKNVQYMSDAAMNLISWQILEKQDFKITFKSITDETSFFKITNTQD